MTCAACARGETTIVPPHSSVVGSMPVHAPSGSICEDAIPPEILALLRARNAKLTAASFEQWQSEQRLATGPEVRVISLTQPWATLVAIGAKRVETRSWGTHYRGPVAIHAAKGFPKPAQSFAHELVAEGVIPDTLPFGSILALVHLNDVIATEAARLALATSEIRFGDYAPGRRAWLFDDSKRRHLAEPIVFKGGQGLRRLDPAIAAQLLAL